MRITFSGVDVKTDISALEKLYDKYDFIEFGILIDKKNSGVDNRFPSLEFIDRLILARLPITCQVYGDLARDFLETGSKVGLVDYLGERRICNFKHIQLSTDGIKEFSFFEVPDYMKLILQCSSDKSRDFFWEMIRSTKNQGRLYMLLSKLKISKLDFYPNARNIVGYKGGICEDNIAYISGYLDGITHDSSYWFNIEEEVRTDDWFDTEKVERICNEVVKG